MFSLINNYNRRQDKRGFTLIELLVSIAIIGILAAIVTSSLSSSRAKSRDGKRISDIKQTQLALENYYDACREYPADLESLTVSANCPSGAGTSPVILNDVPTDPMAANGHPPYSYTLVGGSQGFLLQATLEQYNNVLASDDDTSNTATNVFDVVGP